MSAPSGSRFTSQNKTAQERLSSNTVGLVALSDFRKRRAEVLEQHEREAREAAVSVPATASASASAAGTPAANATPDRSLTSTPDNTSNNNNSARDTSIPPPKKKKKSTAAGTAAKKIGGAKLSFGGDDEDGDADSDAVGDGQKREKVAKFKANSTISVVPRSLTKSALRREAAEREILRREFLARQEALKVTEIAIPFVFYDGTNIPGGSVRVKKGDFVWVFLDKSRKLGADLAVGDKARAQKEWARIGVDDLLLVRGNVIIPHHYDFLFFIMNKSTGPSGKPLFGYSAEASKATTADGTGAPPISQGQPDMNTLEGATDDPSYTKVVDRRWYERNKHIYPASMWRDFDPEMDYQKETRRDLGGNTFFYS
ncbi:putative xap5 domain-containing protein [Eutypa lata UCREL1]|uniref:Putative xap5 domain-containing protein n=1 Tax=Eutypa lata (strain UCR-EL1) TaxID=1287681 RepID=M7SMT4_EUTLA|nr:putative xap5 domain-containing protein [Eutypa lata UCREL1]